MFKKLAYESAVNEDALPGTIVLTLDVTDADTDLSTPVDFYIIDGDPSSQFQIRKTGELYVAKPLDRETVPRYDLSIIVTDGLFTHTAKVSIIVLDVNGKFLYLYYIPLFFLLYSLMNVKNKNDMQNYSC